MHKQTYKQFGENLYTETLSNGLTVNLLPKKDFIKLMLFLPPILAQLIEPSFPRVKLSMSQPDGIAHFLEHKMFDKKIRCF